MNISLKIKQLREEKKLSQDDFAQQIGVKRTTVGMIETGKQMPTIETLTNIVNIFGVDFNYLLDDKKGNLKGNPKGNLTTEKEDILAVQSDQEGIPLIPIEAMAGFGTAESVQVFENQLTERYVIPEFTGKVDFFIRVYGTSMYPKYNSGDIVACKRIESLSFVQWNKTYVLDTTQGALVKRLIKSSVSGNIVCRSDNKDYPDFELEINSDIHAIALIIGVIRFE